MNGRWQTHSGVGCRHAEKPDTVGLSKALEPQGFASPRELATGGSDVGYGVKARMVTEILRPVSLLEAGTSCVKAMLVAYGSTRTLASAILMSLLSRSFQRRSRNVRLSPKLMVTMGHPS